MQFLIKFHDSKIMYYMFKSICILFATVAVTLFLAVGSLIPIIFSVQCTGLAWELTPHLQYSKDRDKISDAVFVIVTFIHIPIWLFVMYYVVLN